MGNCRPINLKILGFIRRWWASYDGRKYHDTWLHHCRSCWERPGSPHCARDCRAGDGWLLQYVTSVWWMLCVHWPMWWLGSCRGWPFLLSRSKPYGPSGPSQRTQPSFLRSREKLLFSHWTCTKPLPRCVTTCCLNILRPSKTQGSPCRWIYDLLGFRMIGIFLPDFQKEGDFQWEEDVCFLHPGGGYLAFYPGLQKSYWLDQRILPFAARKGQLRWTELVLPPTSL